jgi:hypothetical protein
LRQQLANGVKVARMLAVAVVACANNDAAPLTRVRALRLAYKLPRQAPAKLFPLLLAGVSEVLYGRKPWSISPAMFAGDRNLDPVKQGRQTAAFNITPEMIFQFSSLAWC